MSRRWTQGLALVAAGVCLPHALSGATSDGLEVTPPASVGGFLTVKASPPSGTEWVVFFYRITGEAGFQSLNLEAQPDHTFSGTLKAALPSGVKLEYYAAIKMPTGIEYLPMGAPSTFGTVQMPGPTVATAPAPAGQAGGAAPSPEALDQAPAEPAATAPPVHGPIYLDSSYERLAHHQNARPDGSRTIAAGQIRLATQTDLDGKQLLVNTRLVYTNQVFGAQSRWSLGDLQMAFLAGNHRVQVGDMMMQESEFTVAGAGRRGFDYTYTGQPQGAHLFASNTQTQPGLRGLFWPVAGSELYGGSLGVGWLNGNLRAKVVFLSGKDNPSTAVNMVTAYAAPVRDGSTGAILLDGGFLENRLTLSGEYARSLFTKDMSASARVTDQAWRLSGMWAEGPFSAQVGYRDVGRDFGTVGVVFFIGDRRTFNSSVALNQATWSLSATATDERTNPTGQAGLNQAWNQSQSLDGRLALTQSLFWRVGLRQARQEAEVVANPLIPFSNSSRTGITTGFDLVLPPSSTLSFNAQSDRIRSLGGLDSSGTSTTLSLGGALGLGVRLRLSPNLSWSRTLNTAGAQKTTVENAFLNAEVVLVQGVLGFLLNGGNSRTLLVTGEALTSTIVEGTLRASLDNYLRGRAQASLGVRGRYTRAPGLGATSLSAPGAQAALATDNQVSILLNLSY